MSGETNFVGVLKSKGVEINLDSTSASTGYVATLDSDGKIKLKEPQVGGTTGETYIIETYITNTQAGAIAPQTTIQSGTTLTEFAKMLTISTFTLPTYSLITNQSANIETGTILDVLVTYNYNRGSINGKIVGGIWQPATMQDYRGGAATQYIINGTNMSTTNNRTISSYQIVDGSNTFSGSVTYLAGPQPIDSLGNNYDSPYPSGTVSRTTSIMGKRNTFGGGCIELR